MKSFWIGSREVKKRIELFPKFIAQTIIDAVVKSQNSGDIPLNIRVEDHLHLWRSRSTRRVNSSRKIVVTFPDSRSCSRCSTSSSEISVPGGGSVSRSLAASEARSTSERASA